MNITSKGLDLIKDVEGYHDALPDGGCKAYLCPAGKWTCGWGSTEGVTPTTRWTVEQAEAALLHEMQKHVTAVEKLLSVEVTQNQFDALVSLSYNVGAGAIAKSDLLKHLNSGDTARAASHFADFKYAKVKGETAKRMGVPEGTRVVLPGLVKRRAAEAALFLANAEPERMVQAVAEPTQKITWESAKNRILAFFGVGGIGGSAAASNFDLVGIFNWLSTEAGEFGKWALAPQNIKYTGPALIGYWLIAHGLPKLGGSKA